MGHTHKDRHYIHDDQLKRLKSKSVRVEKEPEQCVKYEPDELMVSDHAMVRFFERVLGYDIGKIKSEILSDQVKTLVDKLGCGKFPNGKYHVVVKDKVVRTII